MRAVIFANGELNSPASSLPAIRPDDVIIAADGGTAHCLTLGYTPHYIIGDLDSLDGTLVSKLEAEGVLFVRHPARKDYTDLELALLHALKVGASQVLVLGALGARWDQTLANLLLVASKDLERIQLHLLDGAQEILPIRARQTVWIRGQSGDTVSLIPLAGDARGITTRGLEYPLAGETLVFGSTRGISNVLLGQEASIHLVNGLLLCVVIHKLEGK